MRRNTFALIINHVSYRPLSREDIDRIDRVLESGGRDIEFRVDGDLYRLTVPEGASVGWAELHALGA